MNNKIDALIAEKIMGKVNVRYFRSRFVWDNVGYINGKPIGDVMGVVDVPEYSTNISDAWQVVKSLKDKYRVDLVVDVVDCYVAVMDSENMYEAFAQTAPMAICLAALKAVGVEVPQ